MAHMDADSVREELRTALIVSTVNNCVIELKIKAIIRWVKILRILLIDAVMRKKKQKNYRYEFT